MNKPFSFSLILFAVICNLTYADESIHPRDVYVKEAYDRFSDCVLVAIYKVKHVKPTNSYPLHTYIYYARVVSNLKGKQLKVGDLIKYEQNYEIPIEGMKNGEVKYKESDLLCLFIGNKMLKKDVFIRPVTASLHEVQKISKNGINLHDR